MRRGHLRKNGVVEYSRERVINMADHMIDMFPRFKPQAEAGLVSVDDDLHRIVNCFLKKARQLTSTQYLHTTKTAALAL